MRTEIWVFLAILVGIVFFFGCTGLQYDAVKSCIVNGQKTDIPCQSIKTVNKSLELEISPYGYGCNETFDYPSSNITVISCPFGETGLQLSVLSGSNGSEELEKCDRFACPLKSSNVTSEKITLDAECPKDIATAGNLYVVTILTPASYQIGGCSSFNPVFQNCTNSGGRMDCFSSIGLAATKMG